MNKFPGENYVGLEILFEAAWRGPTTLFSLSAATEWRQSEICSSTGQNFIERRHGPPNTGKQHKIEDECSLSGLNTHTHTEDS